MTDTPRFGDAIVLRNAAQKFDVLKVNQAGEREHIRRDVTEQHRAREIARGDLESAGRIWIGDEATVEALERY